MIDERAAVTIASTLAGAFVCWVAVYGWGKWLSRPRSSDASTEQASRLYRIEQAVDAIAIEVERIGEGQRFTAKLLAERERIESAITRPPSEHRPLITPH